MHKPRAHFHSDCAFFAGCENMLANFFNSKPFAEKFDVTFSYRHSPAYEKGFQSRVKNPVSSFPLEMRDINGFYAAADRIKFPVFSTIVKLFAKAAGLPLKFVFIYRNALVLKKLFQKLDIDLLHVNNGGYPGAYSCASAVIAAKWLKIKNVVYVVNNIAVPYNKFSRLTEYPLDRFVAKNVSVFITGSKNAGGYLKKVLRLPDKKLLNIPNGIQPRKVTETRNQVMKRLGLQKFRTSLIVGIVAIMETRKGHTYLLQAFRDLKDSGHKDILLLIEGSGPLKEQLESRAAEYGLNGIVRFIGDEKSVFNFLNAIDLFILPSVTNEDFPNVTLEAMSLGKPVIATRIAGIPEQIENNKNGILVEPADPIAIAEAVRKIADDKHFRKKIGVNAAARFKKMYTNDVSVSKYQQLYLKLLKQTPSLL